MHLRSATNAVLKGYRSNLMRSFNTLNKSRDTVLTGRNFNSFAEDPATAAESFQLRRSWLKTESQHSVGEAVVRKYEVAYSALESVVNDVDNMKGDSSFTAVLRGANDPISGGRTALGQELEQLAQGIIQTMNGRYGENHVFSGADGLNVPFTWDDTGALLYRGIPVDTEVPEVVMDETVDPAVPQVYYQLADGSGYITQEAYDADPATAPAVTMDAADPTVPATYYQTAGEDGEYITQTDYDTAVENYDKLRYMDEDEKKFVDIGLGLQETDQAQVDDRRLVEASAFNISMQGITYLGYGVDEDGDPKNIASIIARMGEILQNCSNEDGAWATAEEEEEYYRLAKKFENSASDLKDQHTALTTQAAFLKSNQKQLEQSAYNLNEQFNATDMVDRADAITAFSWAQYSYNAALKVGNSVLSETLMDFLNL